MVRVSSTRGFIAVFVNYTVVFGTCILSLLLLGVDVTLRGVLRAIPDVSGCKGCVSGDYADYFFDYAHSC